MEKESKSERMKKKRDKGVIYIDRNIHEREKRERGTWQEFITEQPTKASKLVNPFHVGTFGFCGEREEV